ncbi:MAG: hypothetical protein A3B70_07925 [Deltaproteobacteria bacterium RIFCSPHIGHO2_02_FULL_40_11]|nr:MAG: hypothetical protein A3B70_07925 [Deltaproteobacteria bacterium RIFCSPHIGHO2_02_FULL_40_11]
MKKKLLWALGILLGLLVIAAIALPFVLDINKFRPKIKALLEENLNAKVELGKIDLSFVKGLGAKIDGITISNPPGYPGTDFLKIERVYISFGTIPSLMGTPQITLHLEKPVLSILKNEENESNLKKILKPKQKKEKEVDPRLRGDDPKSQKPSGILGYFISRGKFSIECTNGTFYYQKNDMQSYTIHDLDLNLNPISLGSDADFSIQGFLDPTVLNQNKIKGPFRLQIHTTNPLKFKETLGLKINADLNVFEFESTQVLKTKSHPLSLSLDATYTKNDLVFNTIDIIHPFGNIKLSGNIQNINNPKFKCKVLLTYQSKENIPSFLKQFPFQADLTINAQTEGLLLPLFVKSMDGTIHLGNLKSTIPSGIQEKFGDRSRRDLSPPIFEGPAHLTLNGSFEVRDHKLTLLNLPQVSLDLTEMAVKYKTWEKENTEALKLTSEISYLQTEDKTKKITFQKTNLEFLDLKTVIEGHALLSDTPHLSAKLITQPFTPQKFEKYLPKVPFEYQGKISIPFLTIEGNPQKFEALSFTGDILIPKDQLAFNPSFFKEKKWKADGNISFESRITFQAQGKHLQKLSLQTLASFTQAHLELEKQFVKPKGIPLEFDFISDLKDNDLIFSKLNFTFFNLKAQTQGRIQNFTSKQKRFLLWKITAPDFSLSEWNAFFPYIEQKFTGTAAFQNFEIKLPLHHPKKLALAGQFSLKDIQGEIPKDLFSSKDFQFAGPFHLNMNGDIQTKGKTLQSIEMQGKVDLTKTSIFKKGVFSKKPQTPLSLEIGIQTKNTVATINTFTLHFKDLKLTGKGDIQSISSAPNYSLKFYTNKFNLSSVSQNFETLKTLPVSIDEMQLTSELKGKLHDPLSPIYISLHLKADSAQVSKKKDDIPQEEESKQKTTPPSLKKQEPSSFLNRLRLTASASFQKLKYLTYEANQLALQFSYQDHLLNLKTLQMNLYDGTFVSSGQVSLKKEPMQTGLEASLSQINIEKFLTSQESKLLGKISGTLKANTKLTFQDKKWENVQKTLKASGDIQLSNGHFNVFNLTEAISNVPVLSEISPNLQLTDRFSTLKSSFFIQDQMLITPDIKLEAKDHLLVCEGKAGFDGSLNYKGSYYLTPKPDFKSEIPFTVTGTVSSPVPLPDLGRLIQNKVQGVFEKILTPKSKGQPEEEGSDGAQKEGSGNLIEDLLKDTLP